jgi:hypothetical protein
MGFNEEHSHYGECFRNEPEAQKTRLICDKARHMTEKRDRRQHTLQLLDLTNTHTETLIHIDRNMESRNVAPLPPRQTRRETNSSHPQGAS